MKLRKLASSLSPAKYEPCRLDEIADSVQGRVGGEVGDEEEPRSVEMSRRIVLHH